MNAEPHTHEVQLRREYAAIGRGVWLVQYGDTEVYASRFGKTSLNSPKLPSERRINKAIAKAIAQHDAGSVRAGHDHTHEEQAKEAIRDLNNHLHADRGRWGKQVLSDRHAH